MNQKFDNCISNTVALWQVTLALPWGFTLLDYKRGYCSRNSTTQWLQFISHNSPASLGHQGSPTPWCHVETLVPFTQSLCCPLRWEWQHGWKWQHLTSRWAEEKEAECKNAACLQVGDDLYLDWIQPLLTSIGPNLVTWPHLATREAGKYSLAGKLCAQEDRADLQKNGQPHK